LIRPTSIVGQLVIKAVESVKRRWGRMRGLIIKQCPTSRKQTKQEDLDAVRFKVCKRFYDQPTIQATQIRESRINQARIDLWYEHIHEVSLLPRAKEPLEKKNEHELNNTDFTVNNIVYSCYYYYYYLIKK